MPCEKSPTLFDAKEMLPLFINNYYFNNISEFKLYLDTLPNDNYKQTEKVNKIVPK